MATEQERQLFHSCVLAEVGRQAVGLPRSKVTGFMSMRGFLYDYELMVVGRAVNGWDKGVLPEDLARDAVTECYSHAVLNSVNGDGSCPMKWVIDYWGNEGGDYNTKRSAFWRVIRAVLARLEMADLKEDSWSSHLVWSNLYKIAPAEGGNPSNKLCEIQLAGCRELFKLELITYTPRRLLLLTGTEWAEPFLADFDGKSQVATGSSYAKQYGTLSIIPDRKPVKFVVAAHPQGKQEKPWVMEVCSAFDHCS